jgi:glutamate synthase (NADPH/NADH) large chain/glutamate synthase (ferredoxin)
MGISTIQSYNGAQIFEAVGLAPELIERHFTGTASRIGGIGLDVLARETLDRHAARVPEAAELLPVGGVYAWRRDGEHHQWNPRRSPRSSTPSATAARRPTTSGRAR